MERSIDFYDQGDVVVVPFPFTDTYETKNRPAVVLSNLGDGNVMLCAITSKNKDDGREISINDDDFAEGRLVESPCYIRPDKIFTVSDKNIKRKVGKLKHTKICNLIQSTTELIQNSAKKPQSPALQRPKRRR